MAKITTITNPLTGQPAQVDQLDHTAQEIDDAIARSLPGGAIDTLLQNKAPAGYGLGGSYGAVLNDANDAVVDGKYSTNAATTNLPNGVNGAFGVIEVTTVRSDKSITQIFRPGTQGMQPYTLRRLCMDGVWKPWEWVNPPMQLGGVDADGNQINEYRTTELFYGCPVYKKLVTLGKAPAAGSTATIDGGHGISGIKYAISAVPLLYKSNWTVALQGSSRVDDVDFNTTNISVKISSLAGDLSSYELLVLLTYAKAD